MVLVKTSVPQCVCGNVPVGDGRAQWREAGFCGQTKECRIMRSQVAREEIRSSFAQSRHVGDPTKNLRTYTPEQRARKKAKNEKRKRRGKC